MFHVNVPVPEAAQLARGRGDWAGSQGLLGERDAAPGHGHRRTRYARPLRTLVAMLAAGVLALSSEPAHAAPQWSAGLTTGGALTDVGQEHGPRFAYYLGGRLDLLLLRERAGAMALGPYVDVATTAFDTFSSGGGLEWLIPTGETVLILSGGAFARTSVEGWKPGGEATLFWGSRSFNYHGTYSLGVGVFVQGRKGFAGSRQADAVLGVQIDLEYFALPFLFAYEAITR